MRAGGINLVLRQEEERMKVNDSLRFVRKSMEDQGERELFFKAFLKPKQITLKTSVTENDRSKIGCLPYGLKQVLKANIEDKSMGLVDFSSINLSPTKNKNIDAGDDLDRIKSANCDNLISLMKSTRQNFQLKLAICVCAYNQQKQMLKQTLRSINRNIETFIRNGVSYNDIGVFVFFDGIERVDKSVEEYFEDLQKNSNIYFEEFHNINVSEMAEEEFRNDEFQVNNYNHLIFDDEEFKDFERRRFSQRKREYRRLKQLIVDIEKLKKEKFLVYQNLDIIAQKFFLDEAKQEWRKQQFMLKQQLQKISQQEIVEKYTQSFKKSDPLIRIALQKTQRYLKQYIQSCRNLALMYSYRVPIEVSDKDLDSVFDAKMNLFMVTKYENSGKLSSHNWFFNGFCQELKPEFSILLDVGIECQQKSLWKMYDYMRKHDDVGGVCGYMQLRQEKTKDERTDNNFASLGFISWLLLTIFSIQRAQQFQYHFSHLINKPFESFFNFIHVLPGAFSGYRMAALRKQNQRQQSKLLKHYFSSIEEPSEDISYRSYPYTVGQTILKILLPDFLGRIYRCFYGAVPEDSFEKLMYDKNIYLAEDRILCMGLHQNGYKLAYLPDAYANVDSVKNIEEFLGQRRRWMNGSYFAFQKVKQALSDGDYFLKFQIYYITILDKLNFISPGLFFYTNHIAITTILHNGIEYLFLKLGLLNCNLYSIHNILGLFVIVIDLVYVMVTLGVLFYGLLLNNRTPELKGVYYMATVFYGWLSYAFFGVLVYNFVSVQNGSFSCHIYRACDQGPETTNPDLQNLQVINFVIVGVVGLYVVPIFAYMIFGKFNHIGQAILSSPSFIFFSQTFLNTLYIYSLCKIDDVSWGTKGLDLDPHSNQKQMLQDWKKIKIIHVFKFVLYNTITGFFLLMIDGQEEICAFKVYVVIVVVLAIGFGLALRVLLGILYLVMYRCRIMVEKRRNGRGNARGRLGIMNDAPDGEFEQYLRKYEEKRQKRSQQERNQVDQTLLQLPVIQNLPIVQTKYIDPLTKKFNQIKKTYYSQIRRKISQIQSQITTQDQINPSRNPIAKHSLTQVIHSKVLWKRMDSKIHAPQTTLKRQANQRRAAISKINIDGNSRMAKQKMREVREKREKEEREKKEREKQEREIGEMKEQGVGVEKMGEK